MYNFFNTYHILITISLRNIFRNKNRSLLTILAVTVGIISTSFLTSIQLGSRKQIHDDAVRNMLGHIRVANSESYNEYSAQRSINKLDSEVLNNISYETNSKITNRIRVNSVVLTERESRNVIFLGIIPNEEINVSVLDPRFSIKEGRHLNDENDEGVIIGESLSTRLKTNLGKRIVLLSQDKNRKSVERGFRIVGIFKTDLKNIEDSYVVTGLNVAANFLKMDGQVSDISFLLNDTNSLNHVVDKLKNTFNEKDIEIKSWYEIEPFLLAIVKLQNGVLILWYGIVLVSVFLGVINTLLMTVVEREKEFSLYRALGLSSYLVVVQVLTEILILLVLGSILGLLMSSLIINNILSDGISLKIFSEGTELFGIRSIINPLFDFPTALQFSILLIIFCILGIFYPALNASRKKPSEGLVR